MELSGRPALRFATILTVCAVALAGLAGTAWAQSGIVVWNGDVALPHQDYDPAAHTGKMLEPVKIVGVRNGTFSGKVVVSSAGAIRGLRAEASALKSSKGGEFPASAIRVAYPTLERQSTWRVVPAGISWFDALETTPPAEVEIISKELHKGMMAGGACQPIWLTVTIPSNAQAGDYAGTVTISAAGAKPITVPLELTVHDWALPPAQELEPFVEVIQSPESVAMHYKVPLWSDKHFELMGKSFDLLGQLHSRSVYVPLICETNQGNAQSMVRWIKKEGGGYTYDLSIMDKYLDMVTKHMGKPEIVVLYVWDLFLEGGQFDGDIKYLPAEAREERLTYKGKGPAVSVLDPKTGKVESVVLPQYSETAASEALWGPLMAEIRQHLKQRGLDKAVMLGYATDSIPAPAVIEFFSKVMPDVPWTIATHGVTYAGKNTKLGAGGAPLVFGATVGGRWATGPNKGTFGWQGQWVHFHRALRDNHPLPIYRMMIEMNITGQYKGVARIGGDFWPVLEDKRGNKVGRLASRYPKSMWRNLDIMSTLLAAGKDGAIPTARFEMLREGLQECQARIYLEKALMDKVSAARIGKPLADKCQAVLDQRTEMVRKCIAGGWSGAQFNCLNQDDYDNYAASDWQGLSARLYEAAAEVSKALGTGPGAQPRGR